MLLQGIDLGERECSEQRARGRGRSDSSPGRHRNRTGTSRLVRLFPSSPSPHPQSASAQRASDRSCGFPAAEHLHGVEGPGGVSASTSPRTRALPLFSVFPVLVAPSSRFPSLERYRSEGPRRGVRIESPPTVPCPTNAPCCPTRGHRRKAVPDGTQTSRPRSSDPRWHLLRDSPTPANVRFGWTMSERVAGSRARCSTDLSRARHHRNRT